MKGERRMSVITITSSNFEEEVSKSEQPVLLDFWANWCGPCKMVSPIVDEVAKQVEGRVKVGKVNVDENQNLAMKYSVMSIPTIVIIKNGKVEKTFVGVRDKKEIIDALN